MDLTEQKTYWNNTAACRTFTTPLDADLVRSVIPPDARILDYGCGYGRTLNELQELGFTNLFGIDPARKMIARGRKMFPGLDLQVDGPHLMIPPSSADLVVLFAVLTCIVEDQGILRTLDRIRHILRPGGLLLINDFLITDDDRNRERYRKFSAKYGTYGIFELPDGGILRHFEEKWIRRLAEGFSEMHYKREKFVTMNGNHVNGFTLLLKPEHRNG